MSNNSKLLEDEVDISKYIKVLWSGKYIIIAYIIILFIIYILYKQFSQPSNFTSTTIVKPISFLEAEHYNISNKIGLIKIYPNRDRVDINEPVKNDIDENKTIRNVLIRNGVVNENVLLDEFIQNTFRINQSDGIVDENVILDELFFDLIERKEVFKKAIKKIGIINRKDFNTDYDYEKQIASKISSIKFSPPAKLEILPNGVTKRQGQKYWEINFTHNNLDQVLEVMKEVNKLGNLYLKETLIKIFTQRKILYEQIRNIGVDKIRKKIENLKKSYEIERLNRINILEEKLKILKVLDKEELPTSKLQDFVSGLKLLSMDQVNMINQLSYFLGGPNPVEKEIELLKSRKNHNAFITSLPKELKLLDVLLQDNKTILASKAFEETPVLSSDTFVGMNIDVNRTQIKTTNKNKLMLFGVIFFGMIFGIVHILIRSSFKSNK